MIDKKFSFVFRPQVAEIMMEIDNDKKKGKKSWKSDLMKKMNNEENTILMMTMNNIIKDLIKMELLKTEKVGRLLYLELTEEGDKIVKLIRGIMK